MRPFDIFRAVTGTYPNEGFTQKEIGEILGRTQSTISSWLSNM
ncbi:sigma factor-like helix-turn-helix DNA-binding protein [Geobacillus sp. E263]